MICLYYILQIIIKNKITNLSDQISKTKTVQVSLLGPSGVGKTILIQFLQHGTFSRAGYATTGVDFKRYKLQQNKYVELWDNPGQQGFRHIVWEMNKRFKAFIFMFDLSNGQSFSQIQQWLQQLQQKLSMEKIIFYAFGNKTDVDRKIEKDFIQNFWAQKGIQYNEISFVNNGNTKKVLDRVLSEIWYKMAYLQIQQQNDMRGSFSLQKPIEEKDKKAKRRCC